MLKLIKTFLILILILILVIAVLRNSLCRLLLTYATAKATEFKLSIEEINLDILNSSLYMRGVTLFNPPGFENKVLAKVKEIFIEYDLLALLGGNAHLRKLKLDIGEINIIRNELGNSNVAAFKKSRKKKSKAKATSNSLPASVAAKNTIPVRQPKFLVDSLELSIDELTYTNHQAEIGETAVTVFKGQGPLNYTNVSNLNEVVSAVSTRAGFRHLLLNNLLEVIPTDALKDTAETFKQKLKDYLPELE